MLIFSHVLKSIKWQDFLEEGKKMTGKRFEQVQRFIAAKKVFWVWGTLNISEAQP